MKKLKCCYIILILLMNCQSSDKKETNSVCQDKEMVKGQFVKSDSAFLEMINNEIILNPNEKKFISDITKLKSIKLISCDSMSIHYKDVVDNKVIELELFLKRFDKKNHKIKYKKGNYPDCLLIDEKEPWGGYYGCPNTEIDKFKILVNGNKIEMQKELTDIFDLNMCNADYKENFNPNPLLKYDEEHGVFYLYVKGGTAANTYFAKFVFDDKQFVKRYLLDYVQLSKSGSFRGNFKGF